VEYYNGSEVFEVLEPTVLRRISKCVRVRAALALVALYSFCLLVPPAALALGDNAVHCLTDKGHSAVSTHIHADGTVHVHATVGDQQDADGSTDQGSHPGNCCGVACLSAIAPLMPADLLDQARFTSLVALIADRVDGRAPERLYRPPISL